MSVDHRKLAEEVLTHSIRYTERELAAALLVALNRIDAMERGKR